MQIFNTPTENLIPYEKNAKMHPAEQVQKIANSIREFGFSQPIVTDPKTVVVTMGRMECLTKTKL